MSGSGQGSEFGESTSSGACWGRRWFNNKTSPATADPDVTQNLPRYTTSEERYIAHTPENTNINRNKSRFVSIKDPNQNHQLKRMEPDEEVDYVNIIPFEKYDQSRVRSHISSLKTIISFPF